MIVQTNLEPAMNLFKLESPYSPAGGQPGAIRDLCAGLEASKRFQTLLGVTGSGKTFTIASVISRFDLPVLVITHNKTLAAQLYAEFRAFFPSNAVCYFVSYYDYYQPEAYVPQRDLYIEKDASINEDLDRLRLAATSALMSRRDVIVVASVSCIYGLGSPENYSESAVKVRVGQLLERRDFLMSLTDVQYTRNDLAFERGRIRARGDVVEIWPPYGVNALRVEFFGDEVERISEVDPLTGEVVSSPGEACIFPATHFVASRRTVKEAVGKIELELEDRVAQLAAQKHLVEAQRLEMRTRHDIELLLELGYCPGIENYSRHLDGRGPGTRPFTLMDYFPEDFLLVVDESHVTIPQVGGMYVGDRNRKRVLVEHGFRLPSTLDNRPMMFDEFEQKISRCILVSATPRPYELEHSGHPVELIARPTGLVDPPIEVRPAKNQVKELVGEIKKCVAAGGRALATTLTKRTAENLAEYIREEAPDVKCAYLHSDLDAFERVEILRDLRTGSYDAIIGVNLLREGLDLPEVTLVAILDADREGFLRSRTSLIQTVGRTARNVNGHVILYADRRTKAINETLAETSRRRSVQLRYNREHGITPKTVESAQKPGIMEIIANDREVLAEHGVKTDKLDLAARIGELEKEMYQLAEQLRFEEAAAVRDRILTLQDKGPHPFGRAGRRRRRPRRL